MVRLGERSSPPGRIDSSGGDSFGLVERGIEGQDGADDGARSHRASQ